MLEYLPFHLDGIEESHDAIISYREASDENGDILPVDAIYYHDDTFTSRVRVKLEGTSPASIIAITTNIFTTTILTSSGLILNSKELEGEFIVKILPFRNGVYAITAEGVAWVKNRGSLFVRFTTGVTHIMVTKFYTMLVTMDEELCVRCKKDELYIPYPSSLIYYHDSIYVKMDGWYKVCVQSNREGLMLVELPPTVSDLVVAGGIWAVMNGVKYRW